MKKNRFLIVLQISLLFSVSLFAADLRFINYPEIKKVENYENELLFAINNEDLFRNWIMDEYWKADISKADCRANLKKLYNSICDNEENNIDYHLLKSIIAEYLYNLDEPGFFDIVESNYREIEKLESVDYRYPWFLGFLYANAAKINKGFELLTDVATQVPEEYLVPEFFHNYAYVANMCKMPATTIEYMEKFAEYGDYDISEDWLYKAAKENLIPYDAAQFDESVIRETVRDGKHGLFCRPFGFYMSPKEDWNLVRTMKPTPSGFMNLYQSENISCDKGNVTYSVIFSAGMDSNNTAEKMFKSVKNYKNIKEINLIEDCPEIKAYEIYDETRYKELGGGYVIAVHFVKEFSEDADIKMEFPLDYSQLTGDDSEVHYYVLNKEMRRAKSPVEYFIMMDTCSAIYEQSKSEFIDFIKGCQFN